MGGGSLDGTNIMMSKRNMMSDVASDVILPAVIFSISSEKQLKGPQVMFYSITTQPQPQLLYMFWMMGGK